MPPNVAPGVGPVEADQLSGFGQADFLQILQSLMQGQQHSLTSAGGDSSGVRPSQLFRGVGVGAGLNLGSASARGLPLAFGNLLQLLGQQGQVSPDTLNRELTNIGRSTQGLQDQTAGAFARQGLDQSVFGLGLQAAQGQAGANAQAGARQQFIRDAETRKRQDIQLALGSLLEPSLRLGELGVNTDLANRGLSAASSGSTFANLGAGAGGLAQLIGLFGGGGGGAAAAGGLGSFIPGLGGI